MKKSLKTKKKVKIITNYVPKCNLYLYFLRYQNLMMKNADVSRTQGVCHVIDIFFDSSLGKV